MMFAEVVFVNVVFDLACFVVVLFVYIYTCEAFVLYVMCVRCYCVVSVDF